MSSAVVLLGAAACGGGEETAAPTRETSAPASDPAAASTAEVSATPAPLSLKREPFCEKVEEAAVTSLMGPVLERAVSAPGEQIALPGGKTLTVKNFGCTFVGEREEEATANSVLYREQRVELAIDGEPRTEADFRGRVSRFAGSCAGGASTEVAVEVPGATSAGNSCTDGQGRRTVTTVTLAGDVFFYCAVTRPAAKLTEGVAAQAVQFCVETSKAISNG